MKRLFRRRVQALLRAARRFMTICLGPGSQGGQADLGAVLALALFLALAALALCSCASTSKETEGSKISQTLERGRGLYRNLGTTTERATQITFVPATTNSPAMVMTNIFIKEQTTSAAADLIKALGGMAVKGL